MWWTDGSTKHSKTESGVQVVLILSLIVGDAMSFLVFLH